MAKKTDDEKTNVMRVLDQKKIAYRHYCYIHETDENGEPVTNGVEVARLLGEDVRKVFKTLVTVGKTGQHYVFMIPVAEELDLKKAARAAGEKSIEMLPVRDLTQVTGYVRGGCSPIGMKKAFPTYLEEAALKQETVMVSGGRLGAQIALSPRDLAAACGGQFADITEKKEKEKTV